MLAKAKTITQLENVAINDVLPLKATRRNAIANLECFGASDTRDIFQWFRLLISICKAWQWSRMQNLRTVGKNGGRVWSCLWTKVDDILRQCRRPLVLSTHLTDCLYSISFRRYRPLKLPLGYEVTHKGGFLVPNLYQEGIPQILDMHFQSTLISDHVAEYGLVPFSELRD